MNGECVIRKTTFLLLPEDGLPATFRNFLHEEGLVLRVEIELRFIDDEVVIFVVIKMCQEN